MAVVPPAVDKLALQQGPEAFHPISFVFWHEVRYRPELLGRYGQAKRV